MVCDLGYTYGFRIRDEVLTLRWAQIDLAAGTIRLNVGETKSGEGRNRNRNRQRRRRSSAV